FAARDVFVDRWIRDLEAVAPQDLDPIGRTDRALILADLRGQRATRSFERWRRQPGIYSDAVIRCAYYLLIRGEGPTEERLEKMSERLDKAPATLEAARANIDPDRAPPVWVVTAGEQATAGATFVRAVLTTLAPEGSSAKRDLLAAGKRAGDALD